MTSDIMKKNDATKNDLEGFSDFIRSIEGVEVALVIYEVDQNICRINFRSKGNFSVNNIAKSFGGGGHAAPLLGDNFLWPCQISSIFKVKLSRFWVGPSLK